MSHTRKISELTRGTRVLMDGIDVAEIIDVKPSPIIEAKGGAFEVWYRNTGNDRVGSVILHGHSEVRLAPAEKGTT